MKQSGNGRDDTAGFRTPKQSRRMLMVVLLVSLFLFVLFAGFATFVPLKHLTRYTHIPLSVGKYDQCGTTAAEARSRGCIFEVTLSLWVPPQCYDAELESSYLQSPGLTYYKDINLTHAVPIDVVRTGDSIGWFVPKSHHVRHCEYAFRKFHRAIQRGGPVDGYVLQYAHTEHCLRMMKDPEMAMSKKTQFDMQMFPYCGRVGGFNVNSRRTGEWA